ncbi:hypothetical protein I7I53_01624 [Histoplasma capsulatum var. duboisii H88]|uniref:Uncharacterized protein n=1 Tax=Ajellomyces capsulatus (strain H88) TaxID=544711 RepID=A0A8A1LQ61_AJEC8|nr:hypothetical protein I7I53_01624 [Histoplasma capsulatum var. duboisii H88]
MFYLGDSKIRNSLMRRRQCFKSPTDWHFDFFCLLTSHLVRLVLGYQSWNTVTFAVRLYLILNNC